MAARDVGGTAPVCPFQIMASGGHALACASGAGQPAREAKGPRPVGSQGSVTLDNSWPLGSNGTCTVALTERLDHMK